ncbi:uncharacterized protein isoform X1 [Rhodnius prolixus]|uniref:uncharacterized protein isoform X1 n=1 Tax=Rhodnius prolixus TaxID=13249 RepID=UPI003D18BE3C
MHSLKDFTRNGAEDSKFRRNKPNNCTAVYNHAQHIVNESLRECNGLSVDLYRPSEYDRLALSLISPLPNEQDFAINVCTLLSGDIKHVLKLDKHPRILHYLLAHAAVFHERGLKDLFGELYGRDRGHSITHFWKDVVRDKELHRLADDNYFNELPGDTLEVNNNSNSDWYFDSIDPGLFCLGRSFGTQDFVGQRIIQIANILRNLSFFEDNSSLMARDVTFIRFALLCVSSSWNDLPRAGWEMLGNVAEHLSGDSPLVDDVLMVTTKGLLSDDRAEILGSLNIISAMARSDTNEQLLLTALTPEVFERVCSLLSLHDIMLLIDTLECLYSITSLGDKACNCIVKVRGAVDILVSLITVEAQSYGPKACIQMRVVETIDNTVNSITRRDITPMVTSPLARTQSAHIAGRPTPSSTPPATRVNPTQLLPPVSQTTMGAHHATNTPAITSTANQACQVGGLQQSQVQKVPTVPSTPPPSNTRLLAKENEQFALGWLRSTLEAQKGARIEEAELYKLYINWCAGVGRQGVIAPAHFPRCVRSVFGLAVGPKMITTETGNLHCYEGICMKNKIGSSVPSPILKAQLCSPLSAATATHHEPVKVENGGSVTPSDGGTTCSIKFLLANKVTQRQAQARMMQNAPPILPATPTKTITTSAENKPHSVIMEAKFANNNCRLNGLRTDISEKHDDTSNKPPPLAPINQKMNLLQSTTHTHLNHQHSTTDGGAQTDEGASNSSSVSSCISKGAEGDISTDSSEGSAGLVDGGVQTNVTGNNTFANKLPNSPKGMKLAELLEKGTDKRDDHLLSAFNGPVRLIERGIIKSGHSKDVGTIRSTGQPPTTLSPPSIQNHLKRTTPPASTETISDQPQNKKPCLNGDISTDDKHKAKSVVSPSAASLYANLAADILEGETLDEPVSSQTKNSKVQETQKPRISEQHPPPNIQPAPPAVAPHNIHANRQQILLVGGQQYMVAQPHPALVQHGGQTVLVTQQQAGAKAIFFLRPQPQGAAVVVAGSPGTASQSKVTPVQRITAKSPPPPLVKLAPNTTNQPTVINKSVVVQSGNHPIGSTSSVAAGSTSHGTTISTRSTTPKVVETSTSTIRTPTPKVVETNTSAARTPTPKVVETSSSSIRTPTSKVMETSTSTTPCPPPKAPEVERGYYLCEWRGCMRNFKSGNELYIHSCEAHCPRGSEEVQCLWERCDNIKRKRFSLMTHLYDRHCNADVIKMRRMLLAELVKKDSGTTAITASPSHVSHHRPSMSSTGVQTSGSPVLPTSSPSATTSSSSTSSSSSSTSSTSSTSTSSSSSSSSSQQSTHIARAISRRAVDFINAKELQEDNEGPITKSIRLTAALVLRNLVVYSTYGRRYLTRYEPHLASVGLSNVESSRTIAHVLFDMSQARHDSGHTP